MRLGPVDSPTKQSCSSIPATSTSSPDSSLPSYDQAAAELLTGRVLDFLSTLAPVELSRSVS